MPNQMWHWAAFGKHPVASDFFRLGESTPLLKGFSDWVENGHKILISKKSSSSGSCGWRFWARGSQKENIACGVVRDSSDSVGRPYPLLIVGTGPLKDWEDHWDLLPFACEKTWDQIEYLSTLVASDFKKLEVEVHHLRSPYPDWSEFTINRKNGGDFWSNPNSGYLKDAESQVSSASKKAEVFFHLKQNPMNDQLTQANLLHYLFKSRVKVAPNAIFIGGALNRAYLALFRRPLVATDFVQLWSISPE